MRKHFILKEDQVYFNNGTIGPTPAYVINKMTEHVMHYNTYAAETDYKEGSGPELLTGYFSYQAIRGKIGKIINEKGIHFDSHLYMKNIKKFDHFS